MAMERPSRLGGIIHTYQKYDPKTIPSPTQPPPDVVSGAMEYMLAYGNMRELTEAELAGAVRLDPSQIAGLGPSLEALAEMLRERKRKILATYETQRVKAEAARQFHRLGAGCSRRSRWSGPSARPSRRSSSTISSGCGFAGTSRAPSPVQLVQLLDRLGNKYQVDELAAKYEFTGQTALTVPKALAIKEELEEIDRLLKQLEEAAKTAQIGVIDLEALAEFAEPGDIEQLNQLAEQIEPIPPRPGRGAGPGTGGPRIPPDAQGLSALPRPAAGADLQQPGGLRGPAATKGRSWAKGRWKRPRPRPTSSATRWPTWTSPARC